MYDYQLRFHIICHVSADVADTKCPKLMQFCLVTNNSYTAGPLLPHEPQYSLVYMLSQRYKRFSRSVFS